MKLRRVLAAAALAVLSAGAQAAPFKLTQTGDTLRFEGDVSAESSLAIREALDHGDIKTIVVTSPGGDLAAGLEIAKAMTAHGTNLIVERYCLSSCANFMFVAAARKSVRPGSFIGFHGGGPAELQPKVAVSSPALEAQNKLTALLGKFKFMGRDEAAYFASIGFNPQLLDLSGAMTARDKPVRTYKVLSKGRLIQTFDDEHEQDAAALLAETIRTNGEANLVVDVQGRSATKIYVPSQATLEKYGVKGIEAYPYPASQEALNAMVKALAPELPDLEPLGDF